MYAEVTLKQFLEDASSGAPTPGGGSVAALTGALGAALVCMVCNLTLANERYAASSNEMRQVLSDAELLRCRLLGLVDADVSAFASLSAALKLPRGTDDQKRVRALTVQEALVGATEVPMQIGGACARVLELVRVVAERGNVNAVSDAGIAAHLCNAGVASALLNVQINLGLLKDPSQAEKFRAQMDELRRQTADLALGVMTIVNGKLGG